MITPLERLGVQLPQYYNHQHEARLGYLKITPTPFWRKAFRWLPYFVGDKVKFELEVKSKPEDTALFQWCIYERIGNQENVCRLITQKTTLVIGRIINSEGDIEYSVGAIQTPQRTTIFTAQVINKDRWVLGCAGIIIGAIITIATGIILGFIKVTPFWNIWIP